MQAGTLIADKYRVERVIGRGGMGVVVEATHLALQTRVALKFLDAEMIDEPTARARFSREARALAALKGDHICRVLDFGINGPAPFIVMELLVGTDLARLDGAHRDRRRERPLGAWRREDVTRRRAACSRGHRSGPRASQTDA